LSGAAASGYLEHLPATAEDLARSVGATRIDRLSAWLRVGLELGELSESDGLIAVSGRRARAIAASDPVVAPFFRSVAEYTFGPHLELDELLGDGPGRDDLSRSATTIADISRVTEPVLAGVVTEVVDEARPRSWLEIGCGSCVHLESALKADPELTAVAIDLDTAVIDDAHVRLDRAGLLGRVDLRVGDALEVIGVDERFDIVTLLNNVYYFPESGRKALFGRLANMVASGGEIVVSSQCAAEAGERSSVAAAQLDWILRVQRETDASLPTAKALETLVATAPGISSIDIRRPVPGEPFVVIRGAKGLDGSGVPSHTTLPHST